MASIDSLIVSEVKRNSINFTYQLSATNIDSGLIGNNVFKDNLISFIVSSEDDAVYCSLVNSGTGSCNYYYFNKTIKQLTGTLTYQTQTYLREWVMQTALTRQVEEQSSDITSYRPNEIKPLNNSIAERYELYDTLPPDANGNYTFKYNYYVYYNQPVLQSTSDDYSTTLSANYIPHPYPDTNDKFSFNNCISNQTKWEVKQSIATAITNIKEFYTVVNQLQYYFNQSTFVSTCPLFTKGSSLNYITAEGVNAIYEFLGATYPSRQNKEGEIISQGIRFEKDKDYVSAIMFTTLADRLNDLL